MEKFVIHCNGGDSIVVEAKTAEAAANIAKKNGRNIMRYNNRSTLYFIWDEKEENILFTVHTYKQGRKTISRIEPCDN
ncbi:hypothetical protein HNL35_38 [Bacteroides phage HNL35]|nr:hypothetical protein HNL05_38 [Bacteroides phage HNL05]QIG64620.1 hypothetical protein HNL35_38 [Bacteroides phage HNL35]